MPANIDTAMILAAGLGTRMRPITLTIPKPMVAVAGKPMIDHILDQLVHAGVNRAVVNVHYLADVLEGHLKNYKIPASRSDAHEQSNSIVSIGRSEGVPAAQRAAKIIEGGESPHKICIQISDERAEILDSGGGIKNALQLIDRDVFYLCNADTIWVDGASVALKRLQQTFRPETMDALLLLAPTSHAIGYDGAGDFMLAADGRLTRRKAPHISPFVYTGVAILKRGIFDGIDERKFSLNRIFDTLIENDRLHGIRLEGLWMHVGTPDSIAEAETAWQAYYKSY